MIFPNDTRQMDEISHSSLTLQIKLTLFERFKQQKSVKSIQRDVREWIKE